VNPGLQWITSFTLVSVFAAGLLAFGLGVLVGFLYRSYTNSPVPAYAPVIVGLGAIGLWINSANALIVFISGLEETADPVVLANVETNVVTALVGGVGAAVGGRVGDKVAPNVRALAGARHVNTEVNRYVRSVGRFVTVTVPESIHAIDGYDPVTEETRSELAGLELVFPRGVTVRELRERITARLREDYGVGYVDVEVDRDGEITYLALGRRVAGVGPTLPPRRVAVAVTANPPPNASPGDLVQLWELPGADDAAVDGESARDPTATATDESAGAPVTDADGANEAGSVAEEAPLPRALVDHPERWYRPDSDRYAFAVRTPDGDRRYRHTAESAAALVETLYGDPAEAPDDVRGPTRVAQAELRATSGDVATVMVDRNRLDSIDQSREYRLVTLPSDKRPENEFASLLRVANETMRSVRVEAGSDLVGVPVGALRPNVVAIRPHGDRVETLPSDSRRCRPDDRLYVIGRHDQLRKLAAVSRA
jgi:hypothetical protein